MRRLRIGAFLLSHGLKLLFDQTRPDRRTVIGHVHGIPFSGKRKDAFPSGHALHMGALASAAGALPEGYRPRCRTDRRNGHRYGKGSAATAGDRAQWSSAAFPPPSLQPRWPG